MLLLAVLAVFIGLYVEHRRGASSTSALKLQGVKARNGALGAQGAKGDMAHNSDSGERVTVYLQGGLGNQLFELVTAYAYALDTGKSFVMDHNQVPKGGVYRPAYYDTMFKWVPHDDTVHWSATWTEPRFAFTDIPPLEGNVKLQGYFQSAKYFGEYRDDVLEKLYDAVGNQVAQINVYDNRDAVSVHFRRTDYVGSSVHTQHYDDYYRKAFNHVTSKSEKPLEVWVFSDDIPWCREHAAKALSCDATVKIKFIEGFKDYEELFVMAQATHHIMANSSFSWWGVWLDRKAPMGAVVAPKTWFSKDILDWQDIYCDGWTII